MPHHPLIVCFGELMLRMSPPPPLRLIQSTQLTIHTAGAEANVAVILAQLGMKSRYITCVPSNTLGTVAINTLKQYGVDTDYSIRSGERLGLLFVESGNGMRPTEVIYDRAHSSFATLSPHMIAWDDALQDATIFHWSGITAAVSASAATMCKDAAMMAKKMKLRVCTDFNYRSSLWKYGKAPAAVMPPLLQYTDIVIADLNSASIYLNITTDQDLSLEEQFKQVYHQMRIKIPSLHILAMTFRKAIDNVHQYFGMLAVGENRYMSPLHTLPQITDQIGSGDAFSGGLLFAISHQFSPQRMIDFATACGVLKQSIYGDFALITHEEVVHYMAEGIVPKINR